MFQQLNVLKKNHFFQTSESKQHQKTTSNRVGEGDSSPRRSLLFPKLSNSRASWNLLRKATRDGWKLWKQKAKFRNNLFKLLFLSRMNLAARVRFPRKSKKGNKTVSTQKGPFTELSTISHQGLNYFTYYIGYGTNILSFQLLDFFYVIVNWISLYFGKLVDQNEQAFGNYDLSLLYPYKQVNSTIFTFKSKLNP